MSPRARKPAPEPDRSRPWADLSVDEKAERLRFAIREIRSTLVDLQRVTDTLRRHKHGRLGEIEVPLGEIERVRSTFTDTFDENFL